jgi:hypothetical protein
VLFHHVQRLAQADPVQHAIGDGGMLAVAVGDGLAAVKASSAKHNLAPPRRSSASRTSWWRTDAVAATSGGPGRSSYEKARGTRSLPG